MCHVLCTLYVSLGWHMSFAVLSQAFRGLQFPFRDMFVLTVDRNSFTGNNGRPSYMYCTAVYAFLDAMSTTPNVWAQANHGWSRV